MLLSEARRRFPATYALYRQESSPEGFGLFLIRTASNVHGRSRRGVSTGVGSGNRMMWTAPMPDESRASFEKPAPLMHGWCHVWGPRWYLSCCSKHWARRHRRGNHRWKSAIKGTDMDGGPLIARQRQRRGR